MQRGIPYCSTLDTGAGIYCPVCAKLPAPANDAGFRTVETISVHGEGFTLHGDKHNSYSRIQLRSGTKYQVNFAMSTLRCRLQQEFTWLARNLVVEGLGCAFMFCSQEN
ncbi:PREDICTED: uncharacterized protein LOC109483408 [Branchiostoma belcheri]|uniref:Uncharacterized protein LOC109483408 n=1 Tax=Branchiostoma belcheri TaxID=7741 RepID=A0A6P5AFF1_BRABE|nr:PREDICTED: uncharacterized protein LOC109483408 [Branchiostoma belcheri]